MPEAVHPGRGQRELGGVRGRRQEALCPAVLHRRLLLPRRALEDVEPLEPVLVEGVDRGVSFVGATGDLEMDPVVHHRREA